jgi:hypothetical protein
MSAFVQRPPQVQDLKPTSYTMLPNYAGSPGMGSCMLNSSFDSLGLHKDTSVHHGN